MPADRQTLPTTLVSPPPLGSRAVRCLDPHRSDDHVVANDHPARVFDTSVCRQADPVPLIETHEEVPGWPSCHPRIPQRRRRMTRQWWPGLPTAHSSPPSSQYSFGSTTSNSAAGPEVASAADPRSDPVRSGHGPRIIRPDVPTECAWRLTPSLEVPGTRPRPTGHLRLRRARRGPRPPERPRPGVEHVAFPPAEHADSNVDGRCIGAGDGRRRPGGDHVDAEPEGGASVSAVVAVECDVDFERVFPRFRGQRSEVGGVLERGGGLLPVHREEPTLDRWDCALEHERRASWDLHELRDRWIGGELGDAGDAGSIGAVTPLILTSNSILEDTAELKVPGRFVLRLEHQGGGVHRVGVRVGSGSRTRRFPEASWPPRGG